MQWITLKPNEFGVAGFELVTRPYRALVEYDGVDKFWIFTIWEDDEIIDGGDAFSSAKAAQSIAEKSLKASIAIDARQANR